MDFIHSLADFGNLTGGARLFLEFIVAFVGGLFVADGVRFFFVDGFFFEGSGRGEGRSLGFENLKLPLICLLGIHHHLVCFFDEFLFFNGFNGLCGSFRDFGDHSRSRRVRQVLATKFAVPIHGGRGFRNRNWSAAVLYRRWCVCSRSFDNASRGAGEDRFVLRKSSSQRSDRLRQIRRSG